MKIKTVLINHFDSFIWNIKNWLEKGDFEVDIISYSELNQTFYKNFDFIKNYQLILLSPGPKSPIDYPLTLKIVDKYSGIIPIFGICLGMQLLLYKHGVLVKPITPPYHGKKTDINIIGGDFFKNISQCSIARYHSLGTSIIPDCYSISAKTDDNIIMAIEDKKNRVMAVQFHPESFLTEKSDIMRDNLYEWVMK
ncbi:aminodeoxychorismate/anthranilate synthase component II [bacterium]|nr:aminodeoxychorismate/anthranilate synthase component II [bacterium]